MNNSTSSSGVHSGPQAGHVMTIVLKITDHAKAGWIFEEFKSRRSAGDPDVSGRGVWIFAAAHSNLMTERDQLRKALDWMLKRRFTDSWFVGYVKDSDLP